MLQNAQLREEVELLKALVPKDEKYFAEKYKMLLRKRDKNVREFYVHLSMYVIAHIFMVVIYFISGRGFPWFVFPLIFWGIGLLVNYSMVARSLNLNAYKRRITLELEQERQTTL